MYLEGMGVLSLLTCKTGHFVGLKFMSQASSNSSSLQRSSCNVFASDKLLIHKYKAVLSANSPTLDLTCSGRSFM